MNDQARVGGNVVAAWMQRRGITNFFHVPGESFLPVLDSLLDMPSVTVATNRHEAGAAFAAEAFAKIAGRPAVCMATRGPGASNLMIGVQTASYDGTPLIALVGMVPRANQATRAFQDFDLAALFGSIAKRAFMVNDVAAIEPALDQALAIATGGRPGPVVLGFPLDVMSGAVTPRAATDSGAGIPLVTAPAIPQGAAGEVMALVQRAKRPVVLMATASVRGGTASRVERLAEITGISVYGGWRRFSAFDNAHPNFVGSLGLGGWEHVRRSIRQADLIVSLGFGLEQISALNGDFNRADLTIVQVSRQADADGARHAARADVRQIEGDPGEFAASVLEWCAAHPDAVAGLRERLSAITAAAVAGHPARSLPSGGEGRVRLERFMDALNAVLPANAIVTSDAGNFAQWLLRYVSFDQQRSYVGALNGAMGYGLPAAVGAQLAARERSCWCIAGDGGFVMLAGEMATAKRLGLNIKAIVVNNESYGSIRAKQEDEYPGRVSGTDIGGVDFITLARAYGWSARKVQRDSEVTAALEEARSSQGCHLVEVTPEHWPFGLEGR